MLLALDDAPDSVETEVAVQIGNAAPDDPLDSRDRDAEPVGELLHRGVHGDVIAQPGKGD
jgi:hypothetical protein